ncbi:MAG: hypothetical protein ACXVRQ_10105 [Gaiellaceae bacterium]
MAELWTPVIEGPHEAFVERLHRTIAHFAEVTSVATPLVEVELADGSRFVLDRIEPEPGFGMVTIYVHAPRDPDGPDAIVIPIGTILRIELRSEPDEQIARLGFAVPPPA